MDNQNPTSVLASQDAKSTEDLLVRIGQLTRMLRDSMRELGLDQAIEEAAQAIPDARDRLRYVAQMTEQAANRVLNATEQAQPIQDELACQAKTLSQRWQGREDQAADGLAADTIAFLERVPSSVARTNAHLLDIMMAQDFQDLTGQVIMKMMDVVGTIERELLQVLLDNVPTERRADAQSATLMNGPQTSPAGKPDVVTDQGQVDDLLASLGF